MLVGVACRMARLAPVAVLLLSACGSTAPYTVPAAAINTALALGSSVQQRAAGGCVATCGYGTVCNPGTGFCETSPCGSCRGGESCVAAADGWRCATSEEAAKISGAAIRAKLQPGQVVPGIGISPQTGSGPPAPVHPGSDQP